MEYLEEIAGNNADQLAQLEEGIGHRFNRSLLLLEALIHSSFSFEQGKKIIKNNEVLEFIGDAVLDLSIGAALLKKFPMMKEGELTRLRASLVNESHLTTMAREINLGDYLFLGRGEEASNGRNKSSILSSAFEALVGAIFMDNGYDAADAFIIRLFSEHFAIQKDNLALADAKSRLQEMTQEKYSEAPLYQMVKEEGPDHEKIFTVSVRFRGESLAYGQAGNKKEAEQRAAASAIVKLLESGWEN